MGSERLGGGWPTHKKGQRGRWKGDKCCASWRRLCAGFDFFFLSVFSFANSLHRVTRWTTAKCAIKGFCDCVIAKSQNFLFACLFVGVRRTHLVFPGVTFPTISTIVWCFHLPPCHNFFLASYICYRHCIHRLHKLYYNNNNNVRLDDAMSQSYGEVQDAPNPSNTTDDDK